MAKKKVSTLDKVTRTVKKAAKAVAATADEYVVEPVGKALGLKKKSAAKRTTRPKAAAAAKTAKTKAKPAARTTTTARKTSKK